MKLLPLFLFLVVLSALPAAAAELYGGIGTTGLEVGLAQPISNDCSARLDVNWLRVTRHFNTSDIDYDARYKASNLGVYVDGFVAGGLRVTGGALVGPRRMHGVARSTGGTITLNGVTYPVSAGRDLRSTSTPTSRP